MCDNMAIVEVGAAEGGTTAALASIISSTNGHVFAIDPWEDDEVRSKFYEVFNYLSNVTPIRMASARASQYFADKSIDIVFIDADHSYTHVMEDLMVWAPKAKSIICGHDCEMKYSTFKDEDKEQIELHREDEKVDFDAHPGVIKALYDTFNDEFEIGTLSTIWWKYADK